MSGRRVLVDFDGVLHRYSQGWADGSAYDTPCSDAKEALRVLRDAGYDVVIFSTRDAKQIRAWLIFWEFDHARDLVITNQKLPSLAIIDDRAITHVSWTQSISELRSRYPLSSHRNS